VVLRNVSKTPELTRLTTTRDKFLGLSGGGTGKEEYNYEPAESKKTVETHLPS
jgi:hypothetical protein